MLVPKEEGPIEKFSGAGLCLFITNVVVCGLWYAILYDPVGTVNRLGLTSLDKEDMGRE
jgi:hypothetical protein